MTAQVTAIMNSDETQKANNFIVDYLQGSLHTGSHDFKQLQAKLDLTYLVILILSILMFLVGLVLLSVPVVAAFRPEVGRLEALASAGFGIVDLTTLFLFKPIERIHKMMGDFSQIMLAINCYQTQAALRLLELDIKDRTTIGKSAEYIQDAAQNSVQLIQKYFEAPDNRK